MHGYIPYTGTALYSAGNRNNQHGVSSSPACMITIDNMMIMQKKGD